jgi:hypothetical protein
MIHIKIVRDLNNRDLFCESMSISTIVMIGFVKQREKKGGWHFHDRRLGRVEYKGTAKMRIKTMECMYIYRFLGVLLSICV